MATTAFVGLPKRMLTATIDGREVQAPEGTTILDACRRLGIDTPTLCYLETLTPVNVCRVCVVEVEGSRAPQPPRGAGVPGLVGGHLADRAGGARLDESIRRGCQSVRAGGRDGRP